MGVFDNEMDAISAEETPFETYAYLKGFRSQSSFAEYQKFFAKFTDTYPAFPGLPDDSDVHHERVRGALRGQPCCQGDVRAVQHVGHSWQEQGAQGPEPYMEEYEFGVQLTNALATAGFNDVEFIDYSYFEGIFLATK